MKRLSRFGLAGLVLLVTASAEAGAQQCTATGAAASCVVSATTSLTIPTILRLTIPAASTPFGTVTTTDYANTFAQVTGPTITVKANQSWQVQLSSAATFWTAVTTDIGNPARATKPRADLLWAAASGGPYTAVTGTATAIGSGTGTGGTVVPLFFRSVWDYALDTPGNYSIAVTFTFVSP